MYAGGDLGFAERGDGTFAIPKTDCEILETTLISRVEGVPIHDSCLCECFATYHLPSNQRHTGEDQRNPCQVAWIHVYN